MTPVVYRSHGVLHINWIMICRRVKVAGLIMGAMATGSWITSIRVEESSIAYKEASTAKLEKLQAVAGPNPSRTIDCLRQRGNKAQDVAQAAVESALNFRAPVPDLGDIPDCPAPKK